MKLTQRSAAAACAALVSLTLAPFSGAAAQTTRTTTTRHKANIVQRHPTMTGVAAGVTTHAALKASARRKKARHQKLTWAERHPTLTGIGAGVATRSVIKRTTPR